MSTHRGPVGSSAKTKHVALQHSCTLTETKAEMVFAILQSVKIGAHNCGRPPMLAHIDMTTACKLLHSGKTRLDYSGIHE